MEQKCAPALGAPVRCPAAPLWPRGRTAPHDDTRRRRRRRGWPEAAEKTQRSSEPSCRSLLSPSLEKASPAPPGALAEEGSGGAAAEENAKGGGPDQPLVVEALLTSAKKQRVHLGSRTRDPPRRKYAAPSLEEGVCCSTMGALTREVVAGETWQKEEESGQGGRN